MSLRVSLLYIRFFIESLSSQKRKINDKKLPDFFKYLYHNLNHVINEGERVVVVVVVVCYVVCVYRNISALCVCG